MFSDSTPGKFDASRILYPESPLIKLLGTPEQRKIFAYDMYRRTEREMGYDDGTITPASTLCTIVTPVMQNRLKILHPEFETDLIIYDNYCSGWHGCLNVCERFQDRMFDSIIDIQYLQFVPEKERAGLPECLFIPHYRTIEDVRNALTAHHVPEFCHKYWIDDIELMLNVRSKFRQRRR